MITFIDTLSATCQRMNDKKDCEPIAICNQTKYNEEKKEAISMARTANVFARVEPEVKEQAEQVLDRLGIPMSNAVGMFLRQIVLQRGIPFEMKLPAYEEPVAYGSLTKEQFDAEIEKGMEDIKAGRVYSADEVEAEMKQGIWYMKYKVVYTAGAKRDLRNIFRYISEELLAQRTLPDRQTELWLLFESWSPCRIETGFMRKNHGTAEDFGSFRWTIIWCFIRRMMKQKQCI